MSEVTSTEVVRALRAAKARIQKYGWVQGTYRDWRRGYCTTGAMYWWRKSGHLDITEANAAAHHSLIAALGIDGIPAWNDAPDRTLQDVLQAFDAAIELARGPRS